MKSSFIKYMDVYIRQYGCLQGVPVRTTKNRWENLLSMRENCSGFQREKKYACFDLVDLKNINNMNETFKRQFCSGCLGTQITTKIGFTDKKCCSNTFISSINTFLQCKLSISIISVQNKTEQKNSL
jgi:hypothetical protein